MNFAATLRRAAEHYRVARIEVLNRWQPECGCHEVGRTPQCESCPSLAVFEAKVRDVIAGLEPANNMAYSSPTKDTEQASPNSTKKRHTHYDYENGRKTRKKQPALQDYQHGSPTTR